MIRQKDIRVVAVNVPTTWLASGHNDFDSRMFSAINDMLLDMLAAVARRDYEQRGTAAAGDRQGEKGREV
uniref:Uncharacterized protein n=1 Tax=Escherichia coli TaxID=562 RepID=A0A288W2J9_ECOLX|nr:hypothetical protein PMPNAOBH_00004 [Escherichia coli]